MAGKSTKRALVSSALAILMCVSMLIGTTFAWFTDTASTAVNKIQTGNLHVAIQDEAGNPLSALSWIAADDRAQEDILWEPGCTYTLTPFCIVNTGDLALKYKLVITGLDGDAELLDVIHFSYKMGDETLDLDAEGHLAAGEKTETIVVSAHMDKNAGNDYMGKTLDGVRFTVYATQDTVEKDSNGNSYDRSATYYPVIDFNGLNQALLLGGEIAVDADVTVSGIDTSMWRTMVTEPTTLLLNRKILSPDNMAGNKTNIAALFIGADTTIHAGQNGGIDTGTNGAYAIDVINGAKLTITGGYYYGGGTAVQVHEGELVITGGFFAAEPYDDPAWGSKYLLNCIDKNMQDGTAKITVMGGTFVNYDPSDSASENPHGNFVSEGYSVIKQQQENGDVWYTVVKGNGVVASTQEEMNTGITTSTEKDVTVVLPKDASFTLDNGIANEGEKSRNLIFVGDGSQTVDVAKNAGAAEGAKHLNYQRGSTFVFENLTIENGTDAFDGIVCDEVIYKNCVIKGVTTLYSKATLYRLHL